MPGRRSRKEGRVLLPSSPSASIPLPSSSSSSSSMESLPGRWGERGGMLAIWEVKVCAAILPGGEERREGRECVLLSVLRPPS